MREIHKEKLDDLHKIADCKRGKTMYNKNQGRVRPMYQ